MGAIRIGAKLIVSAVVALAACTGAPEPVSPAAPGQLVYTDVDSGISIWDRESGAIDQIAAPIEGTEVGQPIWSNGGQFVSWARLQSLGSDYLIHNLETGEDTIVETETFPFFAYWSPDDNSIALLRNGPGIVLAEVVDLASNTSEVVDSGAPYYLSWNPEGGSFVAHIGETGLAVVEPDGTRELIGPTASGYVVPFWTSEGVVHVNASGMVLEVDGAQEPLLRLSAPTQFVVSPDGTRVALQQLGRPPGQSIAFDEVAEPPSNVLVVYDFESGDQTVVHDELTIGFSWSPDGSLLLYHSLGNEELEARVWPDEQDVGPIAYLPSESYSRDLFPFFPQYALSHSMWSPDSSAFVVVGQVEGRSGVWVKDVTEDSDIEFVATGSWAAWSR